LLCLLRELGPSLGSRDKNVIFTKSSLQSPKLTKSICLTDTCASYKKQEYIWNIYGLVNFRRWIYRSFCYLPESVWVLHIGLVYVGLYDKPFVLSLFIGLIFTCWVLFDVENINLFSQRNTFKSSYCTANKSTYSPAGEWSSATGPNKLCVVDC